MKDISTHVNPASKWISEITQVQRSTRITSASTGGSTGTRRGYKYGPRCRLPLVDTMSTGDADTIELESASHIHVASGLDTADGTHHTHTSTTHSNSGVYETRYQKSLRHYLTREALPKESHYRNLDSIVDGSARPTLDDLHHNTLRDTQVSAAPSAPGGGEACAARGGEGPRGTGDSRAVSPPAYQLLLVVRCLLLTFEHPRKPRENV